MIQIVCVNVLVLTLVENFYTHNFCWYFSHNIYNHYTSNLYVMKIHHPISYIQMQNIENTLPMHKMILDDFLHGLGMFSLAYIVRSNVFMICIT